MTCRIGIDPRAIGIRLIVELRPAQGEHCSLGCVEVVDPEVKVKLHGRRRIRPGRRLMARRSLEREMEGRVLALANRVPVFVRVDHGPPREAAVELREGCGIAALQGDSAQPSNTDHDRQPTRYSIEVGSNGRLTSLSIAGRSARFSLVETSLRTDDVRIAWVDGKRVSTCWLALRDLLHLNLSHPPPPSSRKVSAHITRSMTL